MFNLDSYVGAAELEFNYTTVQKKPVPIKTTTMRGTINKLLVMTINMLLCK